MPYPALELVMNCSLSRSLGFLYRVVELQFYGGLEDSVVLADTFDLSHEARGVVLGQHLGRQSVSTFVQTPDSHLVDADDVRNVFDLHAEMVGIEFGRCSFHQDVDAVFADGNRRHKDDDREHDGAEWVEPQPFRLAVDHHRDDEHADGLDQVADDVDVSRSDVDVLFIVSEE